MNIQVDRFLALTALLASPLIFASACDDGDDGDDGADASATGTESASDSDPSASGSATAASGSASAGSASAGSADAGSADAGSAEAGSADGGGGSAYACTCSATCGTMQVTTPWMVCASDEASAPAAGQSACEADLSVTCETYTCAECSCVTAEGTC